MDPNVLQALLRQNPQQQSYGGQPTVPNGTYAGTMGNLAKPTMPTPPPYSTQPIRPSLPVGGFQKPITRPPITQPIIGGPYRQPIPRIGNPIKTPTPRYTSPGFRSPTPGTPQRPPSTIATKLPKLAKGAKHFRGGKAIVGEKGPEVVTLPKGAKVSPNKKPNMARVIRAFINKQQPQFMGAGSPMASPIETGLQQIAPQQTQSSPVANRADIIARALDMMQRTQTMNALRGF